MEFYDHNKIEGKWQKVWARNRDYEAKENSKKPKFYSLIEFPYPSGEGLHVGHIRSNTAMDIISRKRRAEGFEVLYPIGWDAFGLPTENYAVKTGIQPKIVTKKNTDTFRRQLQSLGFSFDWSREINTTDPTYYKWTQWIFLKFFEKGLAYKKKTEINWCPSCKIGLANEEAVGGVCERCGGPTEKREKEQWMLAITKYADRLDKDLDLVDFLPQIKQQQRNWIGRSDGALIEFKIQKSKIKIETQNSKIEVFTTRPDTLFGATYLVLAPEHPSVGSWKSEIGNWKEVEAYIEQSKKKTETDRTDAKKEKTGIELKGVRAINPANNEEIPIFIADYVLAQYGTGAIMAVPAHDERDFEFAKKFKLSIKKVIEPTYTQTTEPGKVKVNEPFDHREAIIAIVKHWSEDTYIALKWKKVAWGTFITGGIEAGQTPEEAGRMEIEQETGFLYLKFIQDFGVVHGKFYHVPKQTNRNAHAHVLYYELQDDARTSIADEEKAIHEILWLSKDELKKFLTPDTHQYGLKMLFGEVSVYTDDGTLANSGEFTRLESEEAKKKITESVGGKMVTTYKLRDWVFSRQRYWGEPMPLVFCVECKKQVENHKLQITNTKQNPNSKSQFTEGELRNPGWVAVPEKDLPVKLPEVKEFKPRDDGQSPLASISKWVNVKCPKCGAKAVRETDTMPNWAGSSWYYLRYTDPENKKEFASAENLKYWTPVDWYNGGMEHTTLHLLYSRFWHKFLYDLKLVPTAEPYKKRTSHGLILAEGGVKMSKSKGNVVNPDTIVETVGADTLRVYEMFMGPFDQAIAWDMKSIAGSRRFLERVWNLRLKIKVVSKKEETSKELSTVNLQLSTLLHQTIKKVSEDIEAMKFNTAISSLMIFLNAMEKEEGIMKGHYEILIKLLSPFAPHITEELWAELGNKQSVHLAKWPEVDKSKLVANEVKIGIQVNGKVRSELTISSELGEDEIKKMSLALDEVKKWIGGKEIKKVIYVPKRLVNIVV